MSAKAGLKYIHNAMLNKDFSKLKQIYAPICAPTFFLLPSVKKTSF